MLQILLRRVGRVGRSRQSTYHFLFVSYACVALKQCFSALKIHEKFDTLRC